jgi:hypothetical protein
MNERQKRLIEVYEHLRRYYGIHTKTGFAEALHYGRTSMSAAMNGDEKYLTDSLFKNICEAYKGVFDLNYLLTGNGQLITHEEDARISVHEQVNTEMEQKADILELYAQRIRLVDDLRMTLKEELAEVRAIRTELQQARDDFRDATYRITQLISLSSSSGYDAAADSLNNSSGKTY